MLVIENIGELFLPEARLRDAHLSIEGDRIVSFGEGQAPQRDGDTYDADGGAVIPGLIDAHTHLVFAGTREDEFVHRCAGKSYLEIAKAGGGIQRTVQAVRDASLDELVELALPRLARMLSYGVTTIEVKSGYGLTLRDEIKMLEAVRGWASFNRSSSSGLTWPRIRWRPNIAIAARPISTSW